ncbi:hypothetical protein MTO96_016183 [Rhipicephalus appendiculatus]
MLSKNLDIPDTPWTEAAEGTCDNYIAEHRRRLLSRSQGELLRLNDVKEMQSQGSIWLGPHILQGIPKHKALVASGVGPPDLYRFKRTHMAEDRIYDGWAEQQEQPFSRDTWNLLTLELLGKETLCHPSNTQTKCIEQGARHQVLVICRSSGRPQMYSLEMPTPRSSEACFNGTLPGRRAQGSGFTHVQPRRFVLHVTQPPTRHAAVPVDEAERDHAPQQQRHRGCGVSKLLPKVTTHQVSHARSSGSAVAHSRNSDTGWRVGQSIVGDAPDWMWKWPAETASEKVPPPLIFFLPACVKRPDDVAPKSLQRRKLPLRVEYAHRRSSKGRSSRSRQGIEGENAFQWSQGCRAMSSELTSVSYTRRRYTRRL